MLLKKERRRKNFTQKDYQNCTFATTKLDGEGPANNRPSTDKLHHFFKKQKTKKHVAHDMFGGVNILSKFHLPSSYRL